MELLTELWRYVLPVLIALVAGAVIGIEREYRDQTAGFRSLAIIAAGSCLFVTLSQVLGTAEGDSTRISASVAVAVGLISASVLFKSGSDLKGLTTAASILLAATLGMGAAAGQYYLVAIAAVLTLIIQWGFYPIESWLARLNRTVVLDFTIKNKDTAEDEVLDILDELGIKVVEITRTRVDATERTVHVEVKMTKAQRKDLSEILVNEKTILKFSV